MKPSAKGFTLLELVVAIGVFAVLSALAYGGLNSILRASTHTQEASAAMRDLQLAMSIIQQDLSQITARPVRDEFGEQQAALIAQTGADELIRFTRRGWRNPTQRPRSTLQRVTYRLEDKTLLRQYWQQLDLAPNPQSISLPLLDGIEEASLQFRNADGESTDSWPPLGDGDASSSLPRAIEIHLQTARWGEIHRLIPLQEPVVPAVTAAAAPASK